jgi:phenylalanyl-tRNA synthetase beta chain
MKLSRKWLEKYINVPYSDEELSEMLTTIGLEVEGVEYVESIKGGLKGVVVGLVTSCEKHPDADKLKVTTVDLGQEEEVTIVCGAPNVAQGQKVLVATSGTTLYSGDDSFKIKKAKIRGVESNGMICAEDELGLGDSHDGIIVLDLDTEVGKDAAALYDLSTDTVFDIGLTPNRSDATSQLGVAKDLYAYLKINKEDSPTLREPKFNNFEINNTASKITVEVRDMKACPRYTGLVIDHMKIGQSPDWMKRLLNSIGVKSINNVVDVTNYILHEYGQPLHAFDAHRINDGKIIVKKAKDGEVFKALDHREFKLRKEDLLICDGDERGMCIAGVFGGKDSGVTEDTTKLFLESAYFEPGTIRRTSMHHNLRTDAAKVFEKGADPNIAIEALKRAAMLICELTGGMVSSEIIDVYPNEIRQAEIILRYERVKDMIGKEIDVDVIHNILNALGMEISPFDERSIRVKVPTNKFDVTREIDLIEEILRIYGFNAIPVPTTVRSTINNNEVLSKNELKNRVGDLLSDQGYCEMMGLSLMESRLALDCLDIKSQDLVFINNTSNIHLDILRPDVLVSGATSVLHNLNRQQNDLKLYEFGKTYRKLGDDYEEKEYLTIFISGKDRLASWNQSKKQSDYYSIKASAHAVLDRMGVSGYQVSEDPDVRFLYGLRYHRGSNTIVTFGEVSPRLLKKLGVKQSLFYAEFEIDNLLQATVNANVSAKEISKFPQVQRDLAIVLDKRVTFDQIKAIVDKNFKKHLSELKLFDVYENEEQLGKDKKSYAINLTFESMERTLNDKELENWMSKLIKAFESKLGATIRK